MQGKLLCTLKERPTSVGGATHNHYGLFNLMITWIPVCHSLGGVIVFIETLHASTKIHKCAKAVGIFNGGDLRIHSVNMLFDDDGIINPPRQPNFLASKTV